MELERRFATDEACREYLAQLRWPRGFSCPACGGTNAWATGRGLRMCATCEQQVSVTAGTISQDTRTPPTPRVRAPRRAGRRHAPDAVVARDLVGGQQEARAERAADH